MNLWDILILLVIAGVAAFAFYRARKRKAEGKRNEIKFISKRIR